MKKIILILFILYAFVSCKKDASNSSNTNNGIPNYIYPTNAASYYGTLTITKSAQIIPLINFPDSSFLGTNYFCNAYFFSSPQTTIYNHTAAISMDSVLFNNVPLTFDTNFIQYYNNNPYVNGSFTWRVVGKNGIHSFTFSDNSDPVYTNYNLLPDTLDHTKALTLPINITNLDTIFVSLGDHHSAASQTLTPGITSATFPA